MTDTHTHDTTLTDTDGARDHLVAVVDSADAATTLPIARTTVRAGGRATVLVTLGRQDRRSIHEFAEAEHISSGEAESRYLDALDAQIRRELGDETVVHVTGPAGTSAQAVRDIARDATQLAIPESIARQRSWKRAMRRSDVPVTVTPSAA